MGPAGFNQPKLFSPLVLPQQSLLGAPPGGRGMPMNPFLNAAVLRGGGVPVPRGAVNPRVQTFNRKPVATPLPVNNGEISTKLIYFVYFILTTITY